jgi:DNA processing protein
VTQAPESSGALITAKYAIEQNRDVFALIANADMEQSRGSNLLLRDGATPVIDYHDVVDFYRIKLGDLITADIDVEYSEIHTAKSSENPLIQLEDFKRVIEPHLTFEEKTVFEAIDLVETTVDAIIERTELPISTVMSILTSLEASGAIVACPGNLYKILI